jgi:hypothetical protein
MIAIKHGGTSLRRHITKKERTLLSLPIQEPEAFLNRRSPNHFTFLHISIYCHICVFFFAAWQVEFVHVSSKINSGDDTELPILKQPFPSSIDNS